MSKQSAQRASQRRFTVSHAHDPAETQAEKAAEVVARGGSVSGWSFGQVPLTAGVHREEKEEKEPRKADLGDLGEALSKTPPGKKLQEIVMDRPEVKAALKLADNRAFQIIAGAATVTGMGVAYGAKSDVMSKFPGIPVGTAGGYDVTLAPTVKSPVGDPNTFGLTLTLTPGKSKSQAKDERPDPRNDPVIRAIEKARRDAENKSAADQLKKEEEPVQREPDSATGNDVSATGSDVSAGIEGALRGGGRPLESATRRSMEARFGQDFTGVRIHDHATASSAAAAISARAFTVGEDIVFGSGGHDANTPRGRYLLAHELAHVVQQRGRDGGRDGGHSAHVHRRSVGEWIGVWLGTEEGNWSDAELKAYLDQITAADVIDGSFDADNKARAIVAKWKAASPGYELSGHQKVLLIKEMLDGSTGDDDEAAILDLITRSDAGDLRAIFRSVSIEDLEYSIDGEENTRLDAFVTMRFEGGRDALKVGRVIVLGPSVPADAPTPTFSISTIESWFDSDRTPEELAALIATMTPGDQDLSRDYLVNVRRQRLNDEVERVETEGPVRTPWKSNPDAEKRRKFQLRTERVLLLLYAGALPKDDKALTASRQPVDAQQARELRDVLVRPLDGFVSRLKEGEPTYEQKLKAKLPEIIDAYYDALVTKAAPRTDTLDQLAKLSGVATKEVDKVFSRYYGGAQHPAFVADQVDANGRVLQAGTLHDYFTTMQSMHATAGPAGLLDLARGMMRAILTRNIWVRSLNTAHGEFPEFTKDAVAVNASAKIQAKVTDDYLSDPKRLKRVNEIDRGWPGAADAGQIYMQLNRPADADAARMLQWDNFQTLIHEYIHTLTHKAYDAYADSFGPRTPRYNTLIEGVDCLLSEIVWEKLATRVTSPELRTEVEGPENAKRPPIDVPHAGLGRGYPSYTEALKLVELGGLESLLAAYFLGEVDRIGGPKPTSAKPSSGPKKPQERAIHISGQSDPAEVQAESAARVVTSGGSVAAWQALEVTRASSLHREPISESSSGGHRARGEAIEQSVQLGGRPLDRAIRRRMETNFGHDFTQVRIHDHQAARTAAASLDAQAFTVGSDIAFGSGGYAPETAPGQHLLAHELMHVVQQSARPSGAGPGGAGHVNRRSAWEKFTIWIGASEGDWSEQELTDYLNEITKTNKINGDNDADNRARAVVGKWKKAASGFELTGQQKVLLIKEMLDGPTFDDDEIAILDLLTKSDAGDLRQVMREINVRELRSNFHGEESDRLDTFLDARFEGGRKGLKNGAIVKGTPVPVGAPTPRFAASTMEQWFASDRSPDEIAALVSTMSATDQKRARDYLVNTRRHKQNVDVERIEAAGKVQTPWRSNPDALKAREIQLRTERVLLLLNIDNLPKDEAALLAGTSVIPSVAKAKQMQDVLARPTGAFVPKLPNETQTYQEKLAAKLPEIIGAYHDTLVTKAAPRTNTLANLQKLGEAAKPEVDRVFGNYYGGVTHPAFVADRVDASGAVIKGTLHDQFADKQAMLNIGTKDQLRGMASNMMRAILTRNIWVRGLNDAHGSQPEFNAARDPANDVAKIQIKVTDDFLKKADNVTMVNEIYRGWPGAANDEGIYQQLGQPTDPADARMQLWDSFQTFVHEYIHTLVHDDYKTYAESFGYRSPKHNALMEGVDCVLEEMVWETIVPRLRDQSFREKIEGKELAKKPPIQIPHAGLLRGYPSYTEALKLIELAGLNNLLAAYFLGRVELIGAPMKPPAKPVAAPTTAPKKGGKKP